jgi:hypothetical protein
MVTLAALAAGIWLVATPWDHHPAPVSAAVPRPIDSTWPLPAGSPTATPPTTAATSPSAPGQAPRERSVPERSAAGRGPTPEPYVQNFAHQPGARPKRPLASPRTTHSVRPNVDGCDRNYGTVTQCVPWKFPAGTTDKCGWLAGHGFGRLVVQGVDRQRLDRDGNGIACDG